MVRRLLIVLPVIYYHHWRTYRALAMDRPWPRLRQQPEVGLIGEVPEVGGLHHHYERRGGVMTCAPIWWLTVATGFRDPHVAESRMV
jgi:hypothetical protein